MSMITIELQPLRRPAGSTWSREGATSRPSREIYVRRRAAVLLAVVVVLAFAATALRSWSGPTVGTPASASGQVPTTPIGAAAAEPSVTSFIVQPGDTLWSIAEEFVGEGDIARYVADLAKLNGDDPLIVGELLVLPD